MYKRQTSKRLAEVLQAQLAEVGIKAKIQLYDSASYVAMLKAGQQDLFVRLYSWPNADILDWFLLSAQFPYPNPVSYTHLHDLGVISEVADRVAVMYCGRIVEYGLTKDVLRAPLHPYTKGLLASLPSINGPKKPLKPIKGTVPSPQDITTGCRFAPRCDRTKAYCKHIEPVITRLDGRLVRCHNVS